MTAITFPLTYEEQQAGLRSGNLHLYSIFINTKGLDFVSAPRIWLDDIFFDDKPQASDLRAIFDNDALKDIEESLEHDNPFISKELFWFVWANAITNTEKCVEFELVPTEYLLDRPKPPGADLMNELYAEVEV